MDEEDVTRQDGLLRLYLAQLSEEISLFSLVGLCCRQLSPLCGHLASGSMDFEALFFRLVGRSRGSTFPGNFHRLMRIGLLFYGMLRHLHPHPPVSLFQVASNCLFKEKNQGDQSIHFRGIFPRSFHSSDAQGLSPLDPALVPEPMLLELLGRSHPDGPSPKEARST